MEKVEQVEVLTVRLLVTYLKSIPESSQDNEIVIGVDKRIKRIGRIVDCKKNADTAVALMCDHETYEMVIANTPVPEETQYDNVLKMPFRGGQYDDKN